MRNVRSQLTMSLSSQVPVSILRRDLGKSVDQIEGIVVAVGRRWTVIASLVDHVHDGWVVIRVQDISEIRQPSTEKLSYVNRVLDGVGHPPAPAPNLRLPGNLPWRDELIHVLATDDLIGVYEERRYPDAVRIGVSTGTN